jgi:hypothetical protein
MGAGGRAKGGFQWMVECAGSERIVFVWNEEMLLGDAEDGILGFQLGEYPFD